MTFNDIRNVARNRYVDRRTVLVKELEVEFWINTERSFRFQIWDQVKGEIIIALKNTVTRQTSTEAVHDVY
jgi:hypothetical protein